MADPQTGPETDMRKAGAANGETDALNKDKDDLRTGEKQAKENRENDPPA